MTSRTTSVKFGKDYTLIDLHVVYAISSLGLESGIAIPENRWVSTEFKVYIIGLNDATMVFEDAVNHMSLEDQKARIEEYQRQYVDFVETWRAYKEQEQVK